MHPEPFSAKNVDVLALSYFHSLYPMIRLHQSQRLSILFSCFWRLETKNRLNIALLFAEIWKSGNRLDVFFVIL